jgi:CRP/FNR family transcriptional regulator
MDAGMREAFLKAFPVFSQDRPTSLAQILAAATLKTFARGGPLYFEGDPCQGIGFLLAGEIRVFKISASGREITLYEIFPGETCILNASCLLTGQRYPAHATGIADGRLMLVPEALFLEMMARSDVMRTFIFSIFSQRFTEIIELLEEVTFGRLPERLADYLLEKSSNNRLSTSHQKIANDLGSSREVISRLLKDFERKGQLALSRNHIRIIAL